MRLFSASVGTDLIRSSCLPNAYSRDAESPRRVFNGSRSINDVPELFGWPEWRRRDLRIPTRSFLKLPQLQNEKGWDQRSRLHEFHAGERNSLAGRTRQHSAWRNASGRRQANAERRKFLSLVRARLDRLYADSSERDLRFARLTNRQIAWSPRDVLKIDRDFSGDLIEDPVGKHGESLQSTLEMTAGHMEVYLAALQKAVNLAVPDLDNLPTPTAFTATIGRSGTTSTATTSLTEHVGITRDIGVHAGSKTTSKSRCRPITSSGRWVQVVRRWARLFPP